MRSRKIPPLCSLVTEQRSLQRDVLQDMFKRLVDAVPEVKFELYSFKSTIRCKEMLEQDCWFENKVKKSLHPFKLNRKEFDRKRLSDIALGNFLSLEFNCKVHLI